VNQEVVNIRIMVGDSGAGKSETGVLAARVALDGLQVPTAACVADNWDPNGDPHFPRNADVAMYSRYLPSGSVVALSAACPDCDPMSAQFEIRGLAEAGHREIVFEMPPSTGFDTAVHFRRRLQNFLGGNYVAEVWGVLNGSKPFPTAFLPGLGELDRLVVRKVAGGVVAALSAENQRILREFRGDGAVDLVTNTRVSEIASVAAGGADVVAYTQLLTNRPMSRGEGLAARRGHEQLITRQVALYPYRDGAGLGWVQQVKDRSPGIRLKGEVRDSQGESFWINDDGKPGGVYWEPLGAASSSRGDFLIAKTPLSDEAKLPEDPVAPVVRLGVGFRFDPKLVERQCREATSGAASRNLLTLPSSSPLDTYQTQLREDLETHDRTGAIPASELPRYVALWRQVVDAQARRYIQVFKTLQENPRHPDLARAMVELGWSGIMLLAEAGQEPRGPAWKSALRLTDQGASDEARFQRMLTELNPALLFVRGIALGGGKPVGRVPLQQMRNYGFEDPSRAEAFFKTLLVYASKSIDKSLLAGSLIKKEQLPEAILAQCFWGISAEASRASSMKWVQGIAKLMVG
jgi:hypothetical protein